MKTDKDDVRNAFRNVQAHYRDHIIKLVTSWDGTKVQGFRVEDPQADYTARDKGTYENVDKAAVD